MNTTKTYKEILVHFFIYGFGSIAQAFSSFLLLPLLTSKLTPSDYGRYNLINLIGLMAGTVFYLGITSAFPRSYFDISNTGRQKMVFSTSFFLTLAGAFAQTIVFYIFSWQISLLIFGTDKYETEISLMSFSTALAFVNTFLFTYLRVRSKPFHFVILGLASAGINIIAVYYFLEIFPLGLWAPILGFCISQIIIFILALAISQNALSWKFDRSEAAVLLNYGVPTILASFAVMGIEWSDRFFINKYLTLADVGIYSLAYKVGSLIHVIYVVPFTQIWSPLSIKHKESPDIHTLHEKVLQYYFIIGGAAIVGATAVINELGYSFIKNQQYIDGLFIAPIIMVGGLIYGSVNILTVGFIYSRKMKLNTALFFVIALFNILVNFLLIKPLGFFGAAISSFLTYAISPILIYAFAKKHFSFPINLKKIITSLILTAGSLGILTFIDTNPSFALRVTTKIALSLSFPFLLYKLLLSDEDKVILRSYVLRKLSGT